VIGALASYPDGGEVLVVDDGSTDGTARYMQGNFPAVKLVSSEVNSGFAAAVNRGVGEALYDILVLLNNDVEVKEDFLVPLVRHFDDPSVFAVCARSLDWNRETFHDGGKIGRWQRGFWRVWRNYDLLPGANQATESLVSFYCPGGFSAFHRGKWHKLGGLDYLFSPFNWEDTDICYRALKRGWRIIYEPESTVYHCPNTTIGGGAFRRGYVRYISRRNRLFFHWKNLTDPEMLAEHFLFLIFSMPLSLLRLDLVSIASFFGALWHLGDIRCRRKVERAEATVKDKDIKRMYMEFAKRIERNDSIRLK